MKQRDKEIKNIEEVAVDSTPYVEPKKEVFQEYKAEATIPKLRVREAPNSEAESIDTISQGQSVTIVEEKDGWGKTKYGKGWVNLKYTRRA